MFGWWLAVADAAEPTAAPAPTVCVERLDRAGFDARLGEAEQAWLDLDAARFRDRMNVLTGLVVPCLGDLVPPDLSARWHRAMALHLESLGDHAGASSSLGAARLVDSSVAFDDAWVGADHALRAPGEPPDPRTHNVPEPRSGSIAFDGTSTRARPAERPALVQVFDASGVARATAYLGPRDPLPAYAAVPRRRNTLIASGAGALVASGVMFGLGYASQGQLFELADDPKTTAEALRAQRQRTDLLAAGAYTLLGAAAGLGAGAVAVGQR